MARDFDQQGAELNVRIAVLNGYTALSIPVTEAGGSLSGESETSAISRCMQQSLLQLPDPQTTVCAFPQKVIISDFRLGY